MNTQTPLILLNAHLPLTVHDFDSDHDALWGSAQDVLARMNKHLEMPADAQLTLTRQKHHQHGGSIPPLQCTLSTPPLATFAGLPKGPEDIEKIKAEAEAYRNIAEQHWQRLIAEALEASTVNTPYEYRLTGETSVSANVYLYYPGTDGIIPVNIHAGLDELERIGIPHRIIMNRHPMQPGEEVTI